MGYAAAAIFYIVFVKPIKLQMFFGATVVSSLGELPDVIPGWYLV